MSSGRPSLSLERRQPGRCRRMPWISSWRPCRSCTRTLPQPQLHQILPAESPQQQEYMANAAEFRAWMRSTPAAEVDDWTSNVKVDHHSLREDFAEGSAGCE